MCLIARSVVLEGECKEKKTSMLTLPQKMRELWNMNMTVIPVIIRVLGNCSEELKEKTLGAGI